MGIGEEEEVFSPRVEFVHHDDPKYDGRKDVMSLHDVIESLGFGPFQMVAISFLLIELKDDWGTSEVDLGLLASMVFVGMAFGAMVFGRLSDQYGRKPIFLITVFLAAFFGALSGAAPDLPTMIVLRFLTGFGIGGNLPVDFAMFMEFAPTKSRGFFTTMMSGFWCVGELLACLLAYLLIPAYGWRTFLVASSLLGFFILYFRKDIPESPRYLMVMGRPQKAWRSLQHVARANNKELPHSTVVTVEVEEKQPPISDLLAPGLRVTTLMLWVIWFSESTIYYGMFMFLPTYMNNKHMEREEIYLDILVATLAEAPAIVITSYLIDIIGRKPSLVLFFLCCTAATALFGVMHDMSVENWQLMVVVAFVKFFGSAQGAVEYVYTTEVYPTALRGTGMGAASVVKRISGILVPLVGGALIAVDSTLSIFVWAAFGATSALASFCLPHETLGRVLDDRIEKADAERDPLLGDA